MSDIYALDIETSATNPSMKLFAGLQPFRIRQGNAKITSIAVCNPDDIVDQIENLSQLNWVSQIRFMLENLKGKVVYAHNAIFDIAFLIAALQPDRTGPIPQCIREIKWRDTGLLCKWLINGQLAEESRFSYSLVNLIQTFLKDHPQMPYFTELKNRQVAPGSDPEYWIERGRMDVIMTKALAEFFQLRVPEGQRAGILTEFGCLVSVANSWLMGIRIDVDKIPAIRLKYENRISNAAKELGITPDIFTSTKRLPDLLYNQWKLPVIKRTPKGNPACDADTLKWIQYKLKNEGDNEMVNKIALIVDAKQASTLKSKYITSLLTALEHTGDGYIYGAPRIFGTYTGRFTYSSQTKSKDFDDPNQKESKYKCSIALHQIPRKEKAIRELLLPPIGFKIYEADASGQESRLMALRSKDEAMLRIFQNKLNFHSATGANIIGMDYYDFEATRDLEHGAGYLTEQRQLGKLTNLSCNYRIGGKALSEKAFLEYDTYMTIDTGRFLVQTFNRSFAGVPKYWDDVCWEAKSTGYTEAFGGRRYKICKWQTDRWMSESSAINVPIQGAGASMKEIAIYETFTKVPDALFALDLHDANFFYVPENRLTELASELDQVLNNIDYSKYWGFEPVIELPYESLSGSSFADVK
jgi:DNA polymerase I-like protein with 3'-5' exonuclease and polymerase domains